MIGERKMRRRRESLQKYSGAAGSLWFFGRRAATGACGAGECESVDLLSHRFSFDVQASRP